MFTVLSAVCRNVFFEDTLHSSNASAITLDGGTELGLSRRRSTLKFICSMGIPELSFTVRTDASGM